MVIVVLQYHITPGVLCRNCYGSNLFASVCRGPKDKFKHNYKKPVNSLETDDRESSEEFTCDFMPSIDSNSCEDIRKLLVELPLSVDGNDFHKFKLIQLPRVIHYHMEYMKALEHLKL